MRQCPLCTATHEPIHQMFIVSHGPPMDERKFYSRCCNYAQKRGRQGCINPCKSIDPAETLEGRMAAIDARLKEHIGLYP